MASDVQRPVPAQTNLADLVEDGEDAGQGGDQLMRAYPNVDEIIRDDLCEMYQEHLGRVRPDDLNGDEQIFTAHEAALNFFRN